MTHGVAELEGIAPHLLASQRAALVAESIRGVRSVSNRIAVQAVDRPDGQIDADVDHALLLDPGDRSVGDRRHGG